MILAQCGPLGTGWTGGAFSFALASADRLSGRRCGADVARLAFRLPFAYLPGMPIDRVFLSESAAALAAAGVFIGTSSWKYPGWRGQLYDGARYEWRGKFALSRFEKNCLAEYAEVFKTVCVDAAYYSFPSVKYLEGLASQVPADFQFGFKVTDEITVKKFPNLPRFGARAGRPNENFLNAEVFESGFLKPCEAIRPRVGLLIFEFSRFYPSDFGRGREFVAALDGFFAQLPRGRPYAVEMRNPHWLQAEYFECLSRHRVAHVYNSWTDMPPVGGQMALPGSRTHPGLVAARFLLKPGRKYEDAVKSFQPYDATKEVNAEARQAGAVLISEGKKNPQGKTFIYVNNRLEGNAPATIQAMMEAAI
jgi:uncharacterized protein YecE (DUF72 family)